APARDRLGLGRVEVPRITVTRMPENLLLQRTPSAKEKIASSGLLFEQVFLEVQCPARDFCGFIRVHRLAPGGSHDFIPKLARLGRSPAPAPARSLLLRGGSAAPVRTKRLFAALRIDRLLQFSARAGEEQVPDGRV